MPMVLQPTMILAGAIMLPSEPPSAAMMTPASKPAGPAFCPPHLSMSINARTTSIGVNASMYCTLTRLMKGRHDNTLIIQINKYEGITMPANPSLFEDVPIFALLDADERAVLAQQVEVRHFAKGQVIFRAGDPGARAYVTQTGNVRMTMTEETGGAIVVDTAGPGDIFGLSSMLAGAAHLTMALALEDTVAIEVDRNDISELLQAKPLAGLDMLTMTAKQLRASHELLRTRAARNPNEALEEKETLGEHIADAVARFGGSWAFISLFSCILGVYILINSLLQKPWDPYPFILLNLFLSTLAAIQAPIIMMSQNRQDTKDRIRGELDYRVNLKAELEITEVLTKLNDIHEHVVASLDNGQERRA